MKPDWDRLAKNFEKNGFAEDVLIAEVDCTVHDQLCKEHEVSGYPTIMTFKKGRPDDGMHYDGPRSFAELKRHATSFVPLTKQLGHQFGATPWWKQLLLYGGTILVIFIVGQVMRIW